MTPSEELIELALSFFDGKITNCAVNPMRMGKAIAAAYRLEKSKREQAEILRATMQTACELESKRAEKAEAERDEALKIARKALENYAENGPDTPWEIGEEALAALDKIGERGE